MATTDQVHTDPAEFRMHVVAESIRLFSERGYESTPVDEVAAAAGVSRRTLFRQFRSKEDLIFADHESLLEQVGDQLRADEEADADPWWSVCAAAELVFAHFATVRDLAVRRYRVVAQVPALRDRELVTTYRYQRTFEDFLRRRRPDVPRVRIIAFAAAVTGAHNYLLRSMIRGDENATAATLHAELLAIHGAVGAYADAERPGSQQVAVVSFPAGTSPDDVADEVRRQLTRH
ncbi:TetR/AcrR family transcriptional regulator [Gordonia neofelifaecis]|uniref:TetR family transcriptional regulator n=1 Tax=Gordonia neofelifaecis NRRL B-59395 TaxID=644548 RepID=F1YF96_9ACTN|nr:TetR/AcrR family transcriptional regulator [Gordonia neofelifaecis]EGD56635.1 TetR family transcriptional regulator [Gordonia neofelifaecis NRRL B-59395]